MSNCLQLPRGRERDMPIAGERVVEGEEDERHVAGPALHEREVDARVLVQSTPYVDNSEHERLEQELRVHK